MEKPTNTRELDFATAMLDIDRLYDLGLIDLVERGRALHQVAMDMADCKIFNTDSTNDPA